MATRLLSVLVLSGAVAGGAFAATITVDTVDPGVAADGWCSLIEAIENANADAAVHADCPAGAGADVIELGFGLTYTLISAHNPSNGLPIIASEITVNGHGSGIVRDPAALEEFRIVFLLPTGNLTLNQVTLSNGLLLGGGGCIYNRGRLELNESSVSFNTGWQCGGIMNYGGTVVLTDSAIVNNTASGSYGGGICNIAYGADATLTATRTHIDDNEASGSPTEIGGGGVVTLVQSGRTAEVTLTKCWVMRNSAPSVPGIRQGDLTTYANAHSRLVIDDCVISDNVASSPLEVGAGVVMLGGPGLESVAEIRRTLVSGNWGVAGGGVEAWRNVQLTITDSTIDGNLADNDAGGILVGEASHLRLERSTVCHNVVGGGYDLWSGGVGVVDATADIVNTTISNNQSAGRSGGLGVYSSLQWGGHGATVTVDNSTIVGNLAQDIGGGISAIRATGTAPVEVFLRNGIVARNYEQGATVLGNCAIDATATLYPDLASLADDVTCPGVTSVPDVMLGPLVAQGAGTPCHAPLPGSPAIDSGDDATCQSVDQLRQLRPWDGDGDGEAHCDLGAVELYAPFFVDDFETGTTAAWSVTVP